MDDIEELQERMASVLLGICTEDFSRLLDLASTLNSGGVRYLIIGPGEKVKAHLDCLIIEKGLDMPHLSGLSVPTVPMGPDPLITMDMALAACWGLAKSRVLTIGVDPGLRPGIAYLLDGRLVAVHRSSSSEDLLRDVLRRKRSFMARRTLVKIGDGDPVSRDVIRVSLEGARLRTVLVDERGTTRSKRRRDEMAAIRIARTGPPEH